jgi:hypothetical protein
MFWLPQGWAPYYAEWLLSFPRAPLGSISVQSWGIACLAVIQLLSDAIVAAVRLVVVNRNGVGAAGAKEPMPVKGEGQKGEKATPGTGNTASEKKEL